MAGSVDSVTRAKRLNRVREQMASPEGLRRYTGTAEALALELGCSVSQVWRYRRMILDVDNAMPLTLDDQRKELVEQVDAVVESAVQSGQHGPAVSGLTLKAKVQGLMTPVDVVVRNEAPIAALPSERVNELRALLAGPVIEGEVVEEDPA